MNLTSNWKESAIFPERYEVSTSGEVKNKETGKLLRPTTDKDGYSYYVLCVNGKRKTIKTHRLVALTFISNPLNKPAIDHINGDRTDNRVENLKWVTAKENTNNPITYKKVVKKCKERLPQMYESSKKRNFNRKRTAVYKDGVLLKIFESQKQASDFTGVSQGKLSECINGKQKFCKGYEFRVCS